MLQTYPICEIISCSIAKRLNMMHKQNKTYNNHWARMLIHKSFNVQSSTYHCQIELHPPVAPFLLLLVQQIWSNNKQQTKPESDLIFHFTRSVLFTNLNGKIKLDIYTANGYHKYLSSYITYVSVKGSISKVHTPLFVCINKYANLITTE